jgi:magnesium chelatase family protein
MQSFALSARAYHRILKTARTIADLRAEATISAECIGEAVMFRALDRPAPTGQTSALK